MADRPQIGVLVSNLFIAIPIETAIREAGGQPRTLLRAEDAATVKCRVLIADLAALGGHATGAIHSLSGAGLVVLVFASAENDPGLIAARAAGAIAMSRSSLLARLPELLALILKRNDARGR
jgi:hypothetical protein